MSAPTTRREIDRLERLDRAAALAVARPGDLLFLSGDYLVSRIVRWHEGSPWSHVAVVLRLGCVGRTVVLESVPLAGVRLVPLDTYLSRYANGRPYRGRIVLARHDAVTDGHADALLRTGLDVLARRYDLRESARIVARRWLFRVRRVDDAALHCAELVARCFVGVAPRFGQDRRGSILPDRLWRDPRVRPIARLL